MYSCLYDKPFLEKVKLLAKQSFHWSDIKRSLIILGTLLLDPCPTYQIPLGSVQYRRLDMWTDELPIMPSFYIFRAKRIGDTLIFTSRQKIVPPLK